MCRWGEVTSNNRLWSPLAYGLTGAINNLLNLCFSLLGFSTTTTCKLFSAILLPTWGCWTHCKCGGGGGGGVCVCQCECVCLWKKWHPALSQHFNPRQLFRPCEPSSAGGWVWASAESTSDHYTVDPICFTQNFVWLYKIVWLSDPLEIVSSCSSRSTLFPKIKKEMNLARNIGFSWW